jgi:hypothetical protein
MRMTTKESLIEAPEKEIRKGSVQKGYQKAANAHHEEILGLKAGSTAGSKNRITSGGLGSLEQLLKGKYEGLGKETLEEQ